MIVIRHYSSRPENEEKVAGALLLILELLGILDGPEYPPE